MRSDRLGETLLPKKLALPVFASDALSSVAYAPDEILLTLGLAGGALALTNSWKIALAVVVVMVVVILSYRQNVHAYPSGGGDYEVASVNLGPKAGLTVGSALLVDYVLTVAVSVSSGVQNAGSAFGFVRGHEATVAVVIIVLLTAMNLRGVRESGAAFAVPVYLFMAAVLGMALFGLYRELNGDPPAGPERRPRAPARVGLRDDRRHRPGLPPPARLLVRLRGPDRCRGDQQRRAGLQEAEEQERRHHAAAHGLHRDHPAAVDDRARRAGPVSSIAEDPATQLTRDGVPVGDTYVQDTVMGQVSKAVFDGFPLGVVLVSVFTGLILVLAANTAFNGFPVLGSILARDGFLPRQLHTRGDRLAFSNGIIILAAAAAALVLVYDAQVTRLIQLYIVGVFVSFTLSQIGMVRHWTRHLMVERNPQARSRMMRSRVINGIGAVMCGTVLLVVLLTKFTHGAGYAIAAMAVLFVLMMRIRKHYDRVRDELRVDEGDTKQQLLPSRVHAIVLVVEDPQADTARDRLRASHPPLHPRGAHRRRRPRRDEGAAGRVGPPRHPRPAQGPRQPVPRDHPPDRRLRQVHPLGQPARPRRRLHP